MPASSISPPAAQTRTLSFKEAPDYESPGDSGANNVYEVTVVVTDSAGNTAEHSVTVKVTNMEEMGEITLSTLQPRVDFPIRATLTDGDNITAGSVTWQWYTGSVTINTNSPNNGLPAECAETTSDNCAIKGAASATYTPVADDIGNNLTAVAMYIDGSPNTGDAEDIVGMPAMHTVLADTRNKAPVFPDQDPDLEGDQTDRKVTVSEVSTPGTAITTTDSQDLPDDITATDFTTQNNGTQADEILTYTLGGPDADSFSLDRSTARLSTKVALDHETKDIYVVTVTATDPSRLQAAITVTIEVTDFDEAPEIMIGGLGISGMRSGPSYAEDGTDAVATYTAVGPESASTTWSLSGDDAGDFTISGSGVLTFRSSPDYDEPADADTNNVYMVTIEADDGTYTDTYDVTIRVTEVDDTDGTLPERFSP